MSNIHLERQKKNANDEFYTLLEDVKKIVDMYKDKLKDKVIYCNCDNPDKSNFYKYLKDKFYEYGFKKVICTYLDDECSYLTIYDGKETRTKLKGNGSYDSEECIELLKNSDVVVTNPPFSKFRHYYRLLRKYDIDFILIANLNCVTYQDCFYDFRDGKVIMHGERIRNFLTENDGIKDVGISILISTLDVGQPFKYWDLKKTLDEQIHVKYDNYLALNCDRSLNYPTNYYGVVGVPVSFLNKMDRKRFEILGVSQGYDVEVAKLYDKNWKNEYNLTSRDNVIMNGKHKYKRIFVRQRRGYCDKD